MHEFMPEWSDVVFYLRSGLEVLIIYVVIYYLLQTFEKISAGGKLRGLSLSLGLVVIAWLGARYAQLHAITWLLQAGIGVSALILTVVFQPELRRLFTRLGGVFPNQDLSANHAIRDYLVAAIVEMSAKRIGGLMVIERGDRLDDYINSGPLDCAITAKSVTTIFWKDSPLHDGAVIIRNGRIAAAGVIVPLTNNADFMNLSGTRHRAAIGISEDTDALALVVSEETGQISVADRGRFTRGMSRQEVEALLDKVFGPPGRSTVSDRKAAVTSGKADTATAASVAPTTIPSGKNNSSGGAAT